MRFSPHFEQGCSNCRWELTPNGQQGCRRNGDCSGPRGELGGPGRGCRGRGGRAGRAAGDPGARVHPSVWLVAPVIGTVSWASTRLSGEKLALVLDTSGLRCSGISQRKCQAASGIRRPGSQREVQARGRHDELLSRLKVKHEHNWHY